MRNFLKFAQGNKFSGSFKGSLSTRRFGNTFHFPGSRGLSFSPRFTMDFAKSWFFTAKDWEEVMEPAEVKALSLAGAYVMTKARSLIRRRKNPSSPGMPPTKWTGLLNLIFFAYDPSTHSVVIGPIFIKRAHKGVITFPQKTIPATLEFGGRERIAEATYIKRYGNLPANRTITIKKRPYMVPAEEKSREKYLAAWKDILVHTPESLTIAYAKGQAYDRKTRHVA